MADLFPEIRPLVTHSIRVQVPHVLYVEECGSSSGIPAIFLHGGPGAGCKPLHRRFFDPERFRIVLMDQRGCGRSEPHAELAENTTWHLLADMERVRAHLGIERWLLFGGSWGATLALAYAETYPDRVLGLVLRGVFLCRHQDINWLYEPGGASRLLPDAWQEFQETIPLDERASMVEAYRRRLDGQDELERLRAARAWARWEARAATLQPDPRLVERFTEARAALSLSRIEAHYFANGGFLEPDQLLRHAERLNGIPGIIVHGRYDMVCPLEQAWALQRAWKTAELRMIPAAGHAMTEPGIREELVRATNEMAGRFA